MDSVIKGLMGAMLPPPRIFGLEPPMIGSETAQEVG